MTTVNFYHHFILVTLAAVALLLLQTLVPGWENYLPSFVVGAQFIIYGVTYAVTLLLALNSRTPIDVCLFLVLSVLASYISPFLGIFTLGYFGDGAFAFASAVGALAYALLVSHVWLPHLKVPLVLLAVPLCALATYTVVLLLSYISFAFGEFFILTVAWWYSFSLSLWISHRSSANKSLNTDTSKAGAG